MLQKIKMLLWLGAFMVVSSPLVAVGQNPCDGKTPWACGRDINAGGAGLPAGAIIDIIASTLSWLLAVLGFIAVAGFVISGLMYLTAAGDEGQAENAKNAMKFSVIGVIVALMGYVVILSVEAWLNSSPYF